MVKVMASQSLEKVSTEQELRTNIKSPCEIITVDFNVSKTNIMVTSHRHRVQTNSTRKCATQSVSVAPT